VNHPDEAELSAFAQGALSGAARETIESHLGQCDACRELVALLLKAFDVPDSSSGPHAGQRIGRFTVLEPIGAGALGEVFSAWDSTLERAVALKWLFPPLLGETPTARARLLSEARAAAKVQHPNVVTVYEVVEWQQTQVIVMELVPHAQTLRRALAGKGWREATARYVDAARGLEAAHAAGVVHCDFKPDNVLIGEGRVRVCDFGLSRALPTPVLGQDAASKRTSVSGTPAYLPPERWSGAPATAATDAWGLCISLWESITGALPFVARDFDARLEELAKGPPTPGPSVMPPQLEALLRRGLSLKVDARFASLAELREGLERVLAPRRPSIAVVLASVAVVATLVIFGSVTQAARAKATACRSGSDGAANVWSADRRTELLAALTATKAPGVEAAWESTARMLDAWNAQWTAEWIDACDATHVRAVQSAELLDTRLSCLTARKAESAALANELAKPTAKMVEKMSEAAARLTPPASCSAANLARDRRRVPADATLRAAVAAIDEKIARVHVVDNLGAPAEAKKIAQEAADDAEKAKWAPSRAEALVFLGATQHRSGEPKVAVSTFRAAIYVAEEADLPFSEARGWVELVRAATIDAQLDVAQDAMNHAQALAKRVGTDALGSHLATNVGELFLAQRKPEEALVQYQLSLELSEKEGHAINTAGALANLGRTYSMLGRYQDAVVVLTRSVKAFEGIHGLEHPNVAIALNSLASANLNLGKLDDALDASRRAVAIREKMLGPQHVLVSRALGNYARILEARGEVAEAVKTYERVKAITTAAMGPDHPFNADALIDLGRLARDGGDLIAARQFFNEALALREKKLGLTHADTALALLQLASLERESGKLDAAEALLARATPVLEKDTGDGKAWLRLAQGAQALARRQPAEAITRFTEALTLRSAAGARVPGRREPLVSIALALLEQGDAAGALAKLDEASKLPGDASPEQHLARARALWTTKRSEAEEALKLARTRWPKLQLDESGRPR
jgi:eukaryotic-like serine/threonine-protein kinase